MRSSFKQHDFWSDVFEAICRRFCLSSLKTEEMGRWRVLALVDCKTVRIFAYSSKREQSNERSGTRLKTESETGERR